SLNSNLNAEFLVRSTSSISNIKVQIGRAMNEVGGASNTLMLRACVTASRVRNCLVEKHRDKEAFEFLQEALNSLSKNKELSYIPRLTLIPSTIELGLGAKSLSRDQMRSYLDMFISAESFPSLESEASNLREMTSVLEKFKLHDELNDYWCRTADLIKGRKEGGLSLRMDVMWHLLNFDQGDHKTGSNPVKARFMKSQIFEVLGKATNDDILADANLFSGNIQAIGNLLAWSFGDEDGCKYFQEILALLEKKGCKLDSSKELMILSQELFYYGKDGLKLPLSKTVEALAETKGVDKEAQAEAFRVLGSVYMQAGLLDKAEAYFERSAKIFLSVPKPSLAKAALLQRAVLLDKKGQYEKAEKFYLLAIKQILAMPESDDTQIWIQGVLVELKKKPAHSHLVEQIEMYKDQHAVLRKQLDEQTLKASN
ncbi:MAG: tetratricopeptide repeat protein, partial [Candidatus Obscuribacterales bacterium]|nr:tetratricopeptide repeat protein [Candidatus Obscuribacterales bacterium]